MSSSEQPDHQAPNWLNIIILIISLGTVSLLAWLAFQPQSNKQNNAFLPRAVPPCVMDTDGYLRGELFGPIQTELNWTGSTMRCDGMNRPDGQGIRLVFDEHLDQDVPGLLIVIGVANARIGEPVDEAPANITVIDQATGSFFSTQEEPRCWTTFTEQISLTGTTEDMWRINGEIYCASPLPALTGTGAITLGDIDFSGLYKPAAQ